MKAILGVAATALALLYASASSAQVDARPPNRLTLSANSSELKDIDEDGGGGSLSYLHYVTPDVLFGLGAEHQYIADSKWTFGALRGAVSGGEGSSRYTISGEVQYGEGDEDGRDFDYGVAVLAFSRALTTKLSVQLETRQIEIDRTHGNLPKIGLTYVWTPRVLTSVSYADSVGGNLGTELATFRIDYYGRLNMIMGGAWGDADPSVVNLQGISLPAQRLREGFLGFGKTFRFGEVQLLGDYLELADSEKVTVTLSFTAFVGARHSR